ncbi:MAG: heme exporter protein CcmD [Gammaproteobacteria bacterium]|nr:heme exporter protein CcmD [Gammaproteobacteria bacterium]
MDAMAMGNYGMYVWSCFGITLAVILISDVRARLRHKQVYREIEVRIKALEERK